MRINKFVAQSSMLSRRAADLAILNGRITINNAAVQPGQIVLAGDIVKLDGHKLESAAKCTIMLHKPVGYIVSRNGQGNPTIYDLLPDNHQNLKAVGRLDRDSSGLILLTNDGNLAQQLTHPSYKKAKLYEVMLDKPLTSADQTNINRGIRLGDGISHLQINGRGKVWQVRMSEGRNRQIRRTFESAGYGVKSLRRTNFGPYVLDNLPVGKWQIIDKTDII